MLFHTRIISSIVPIPKNQSELSVFRRFESGGALSSFSADLDLVPDTLGDTVCFVLFLTTTPFRIFLGSFLIVEGLAAIGAVT